MIEAVGEDDGGEYGFDLMMVVVSVVFGMWIWLNLSCFGVLIYDI